MMPLMVGRGRLDEIGPLNSFYFTLNFLAAHHFIYAIFVFFFFKELNSLFLLLFHCGVSNKNKKVGKKLLKLGGKKMRENFYD